MPKSYSTKKKVLGKRILLCTFVVTLYVIYVSIVHTCFLGSSTVTKRSLVSTSKSSSNCNLLRRDEEEAGLEVSTGVPLGRLRSCIGEEKKKQVFNKLNRFKVKHTIFKDTTEKLFCYITRFVCFNTCKGRPFPGHLDNTLKSSSIKLRRKHHYTAPKYSTTCFLFIRK